MDANAVHGTVLHYLGIKIVLIRLKKPINHTIAIKGGQND